MWLLSGVVLLGPNLLLRSNYIIRPIVECARARQWLCSKSHTNVLFVLCMMSNWVCTAFQLHSMWIYVSDDGQGGPKHSTEAELVQNNRYLFRKSLTVGTGRQNGQHPGRHGKHRKHLDEPQEQSPWEHEDETQTNWQRTKGRGLTCIMSGWWEVETGEWTNEGQVKLIGAEQVIKQAGNTQGQEVKCLKWEAR